MWSAVTPTPDGPAPSSRAKHSATLLGGHVYLLGGRNGNLPLKDLWRYSLAESRWEQLQPSGERPPCLQEHSAVAYRDNIYVFGGEVGFSAGTETPLWVYQVKGNCWRKIRAQKGVVVPRGRRGHTALVHRGAMLIYGGYQDLRGSSNELWGFHFDTESWHLLSSSSSGITCSRSTSSGDIPPARHKHSAILHDDAMWVYGGMTDLQERADFWRWDTVAKTWTSIRAKPGPGALHSHAACKLPSSMLLFGGERDGHPTNELWRFHFGTESWERLQIQGPRPQPRAESVALAVSELLLQDSPVFQQPSDAAALATSFSSASQGRSHHRSRGGGSVDRCTALNPRHSSYHPTNRVSPCERKYVFRPTPGNYVDGSSANQQSEQLEASGSVNGRRDPGTATTPSGQTQAANSFLREISKLSQINLSRLSHHKCSYSVLSSSSHDDSTESLLHQQQCSSPGAEDEEETVPHHDCDSTPSKNTMVKSQSANVISRRKHQEPPTPTTSAENEQDSGHMVSLSKHHSGCTKAFQNGGKRKVSVAPTTGRCGTLSRDPISVPNFGTISSTLPTPVLTPVEVTRLVFVDTDTDDNDGDDPVNTSSSQPHKDDEKLIQVQPSPSSSNVTDFSVLHQQFQPTFRSENGKKRSESYNSHLLAAGVLDCPSTSSQNTEKVTAIPKSASVRFRTRHSLAENEEASDETVSTSDYASIEAVNRISSASNYSMCTRPSPVDSHYHLPYYQHSEEFSLGRLSIGSKSNGKAKTPSKDGPFGFCNPNYLGPDIQTILASAGQRKSWHISTPATGDNEPIPPQVAQTKQHFQTYARLLNSPPDSVLEDATGRSISRQFYQEELMELQSLDSWSQPPSLATTPGVVPATTPNKRVGGPPQFLALGSPYNTLGVEKRKKSRASSASRAEKQAFELEDEDDLGCFSAETPSVPLYMFILGGKEQGQVTVFKRPVSVWKLQLAPNIF